MEKLKFYLLGAIACLCFWVGFCAIGIAAYRAFIIKPEPTPIQLLTDDKAERAGLLCLQMYDTLQCLDKCGKIQQDTARTVCYDTVIWRLK